MLQRFLDLFLEPAQLLNEAPTQEPLSVEQQQKEAAAEDIRLMREELDKRFEAWYPEIDETTRRQLVNDIVKEVE